MRHSRHGKGSDKATSSAPSRDIPLRALIIVPIVLALTVSAFAWPSARLSPRDLPLGVAGPPQATQPIEKKLAQQDGAFDVHRYADEQAASDAIEEREVYGALVPTRTGLTVLTAPAASPSVSGLLQNAFASDEHPAAAETRIVEVVPADEDDPRGAVFNGLVLPLVLSSVGLAVVLTLSSRPGIGQAGVLVLAAMLGGLVATALVQSWLGAISGPWIANAGVLALTMLAIASALAGLSALFGHIGLGVGAALMVLVGNAWSGISSAPELLPKPLGLIGQLLPPGAGGNLLRSTAFFDGNGGGSHLMVLVVTATLGLAAIWAAALLHRRSATAPKVLESAIPATGQAA